MNEVEWDNQRFFYDYEALSPLIFRGHNLLKTCKNAKYQILQQLKRSHTGKVQNKNNIFSS
jgi:hypothetical protein